MLFDSLTQWLVHTGQHADDNMSLDFLLELDVPPPNAMIHPSQEGRSMRLADMMRGVAEQIEQVKPRAVLVYGDTDSTLAGALGRTIDKKHLSITTQGSRYC